MDQTQKTDLAHRFQAHVKQEQLFGLNDRLLVAVSGGVDSVVLCELCRRAQFQFEIAHCNFQLRGEESIRDEEFVRSLAANYGVPFFSKKFDTEVYATEKKIGIQESARNLRYQWFQELLDVDSQHNPQFKSRSLLLTAHHSDDNIETVLMNFSRGTGLKGLIGIPQRFKQIRRPLLVFWKSELQAFANEYSLQYVEDSSNQLSKYTRNLFRNDIIPFITKAYPQVKANLSANIERFKGVNDLHETMLSGLKKKLCRQKGHEIYIPIKQLSAYDNRALIFSIISDYNFTEHQIDEVAKLFNAESGKYVTSPDGGFRIIKFKSWLIISNNNVASNETFAIDDPDTGSGDNIVLFDNYSITFRRLQPTNSFVIPTSNLIACLDANEITFPLILRKWKPGDYFYPLGMKKKKKKLARFLIDQKVSKLEKERTWVLETNRKIIWVVGRRIDDRFKMMSSTKTLLEMTLKTL